MRGLLVELAVNLAVTHFRLSFGDRDQASEIRYQNSTPDP
jgi:hypothetical protein